MEELFYFVTHSDAWVDDVQNFHFNYFMDEGGFAELFIAAVVIGVVVSAIFYFGFCNSEKSNKLATLANWFICMVVAAVVAFGYTDIITIGHDANDEGVRTGFYQSNEDYYNAKCDNQVEEGLTAQDINDLGQRKDIIAGDLNDWNDVRLPLDLMVTFYAVLFYFLASILLKRFTINGKTIPFTRP